MKQEPIISEEKGQYNNVLKMMDYIINLNNHNNKPVFLTSLKNTANKYSVSLLFAQKLVTFPSHHDLLYNDSYPLDDSNKYNKVIINDNPNSQPSLQFI